MPYSEEDPALFLRPLVCLSRRVSRELTLLVEDLSEVDQDSRGLEDRGVAVGNCGNTSVRVDLEEPR